MVLSSAGLHSDYTLRIRALSDNLVDVAGIEPAASSLQGKRSPI